MTIYSILISLTAANDENEHCITSA